MRLSDALENEKQRENPISWNKVYLHKEGKFFHIYEWSAWLVKNFVCTEEFQKERNDKSILQSQLYVTFKPQFLRLGTFNKEFTKLTRNPSCKYFTA